MTKFSATGLPLSPIFSITNITRNRERYLTGALASIGLTLAEWRALRIMHSFAEAIPMGVLIAHSQTDRSALGRTVDRLVQRGWVERIPDPNDKRAFLVRKLSSADEIFERAFQLVGAFDATLQVELTLEERAVLRGALEKIERLSDQ
ncbi:MarR family winged helix-turn-helix transcriptional regulator [Candidatus Pantoea multigeneris]|uniref:MarR family transcriptional regulator n=1 Tax=Candidatus Pantoea multigeneris TaxID=2608357 RepID=A0ABX0RDA6_9GAMM|nr:MarR family transcriptional regulator [Pantoea multigeneris]NIF22128.1 MarR family transcriptional regulator [Pantoea multigeneris]